MSRVSPELLERTKRYASTIIRAYVDQPKKRHEVSVLGKQLLRSGTSVAGHTREANRARSDAEFCSKLGGLLQEADESQLWIELLREDCAITDDCLTQLHAETNELIAIFVTMIARTTGRKS